MKRNLNHLPRIVFGAFLALMVIFPTISDAYVHYPRGYHHSSVQVNALIVDTKRYEAPYYKSMSAWNGATSRIRWSNANASRNVVKIVGNSNVAWYG